MKVETTKGPITAKKDIILDMILICGYAADHLKSIGCDAIAADVEKLNTELRAGYYGPDDFEI